MNKVKIIATYNGVEFELKKGEKYQVSEDIVNWKIKEFWHYDGYKKVFVTADICVYQFIRPIQPKEAKQLTHKEIALNLVGEGVFKENETTAWFTQWFSGDNVYDYTFCFFSDLDTDHEKWHPLKRGSEV
jgi:hypothetical protein